MWAGQPLKCGAGCNGQNLTAKHHGCRTVSFFDPWLKAQLGCGSKLGKVRTTVFFVFHPRVKCIHFARIQTIADPQFLRPVAEVKHRVAAGFGDSFNKVGHIVDLKIRPVVAIDENHSAVDRVFSDPRMHRAREPLVLHRLVCVKKSPLGAEANGALARTARGRRPMKKLGVVAGLRHGISMVGRPVPRGTGGS